MRAIIQLPGILLPISLLALQVFIGNSALDIHMHDTVLVFYGVNILRFINPMVIASWLVHILLARKKVLPPASAWLHVSITIITMFAFFGNMPVGITGMPRRYYEYDYNPFHFYYSRLSLSTLLFVYSQIAFWIYALIKLLNKRAIIAK